MADDRVPAGHPRRRFLVRLLGLAVLAFLGVYAGAELALRDLDAIVAAGPEAVAHADKPLPAYKDWSLFLAAQVLPLRQPGAAAVTPGRIFRDCPDCPEMVEIPAGFYLMGSPLFEWDRYRQIFSPRDWRTRFESANREGPRRLVHIAHAFALSRYEVTFAQWDAAQDDPAWIDATELYPRKPQLDGVEDVANRAVTKVNQFDARAYACWMSRHTGQRYRIPTEAEWEYAARAGTVTARPWGNAIGWNNASCLGCGDRWPDKRIGPVGLYAPNGFGLYDMIGNGREWVRDCFASYVAASITDGSAWLQPGCIFGVAKGESAYAEAWRNRSAYRVGPHLHNALEGGTIRLLRELD